MNKLRYTLNYCSMIPVRDVWLDDYEPRWEQMHFKTIKEAKEYLSIAGDNAYIVDTVTGKRIS